MEYPFKFNECILTEDILDKLGFSDYWAGSGEFGNRTFSKERDDGSNTSEFAYRMVVSDQLDDGSMGWGKLEYKPEYFIVEDFQTTLYFLHDLYENIFSKENEELNKLFLSKCTEIGLESYIQSYLNYKFKP